jgi:manganese-dependent inorganic pyrophosphatase
MEPSPPAATLLLGAVLSDTVILNSPTTTERDRAVITYLEQVLALDAGDFGRQMFEQTSDLSRVAAEDIVRRDAKEYEAAGGQTLRIAQVETVGKGLKERRDELRAALDAQRSRDGHALSALIVTDIMSKGSELYVSGDITPVERAFGKTAEDGVLDLPGVMSRKKQVAPKLLAALSG